MADSVAELQKWFSASFREMSNQRLSPIDVSSPAIPRSPVSSSLVAMVQELTREADNIRRLSRFPRFSLRIDHACVSANLQSTPHGSVTLATTAQPCGSGGWSLTP